MPELALACRGSSSASVLVSSTAVVCARTAVTSRSLLASARCGGEVRGIRSVRQRGLELGLIAPFAERRGEGLGGSCLGARWPLSPLPLRWR